MFAVEHKAREQEPEHLLEPLHAVAVAGGQLATNGVGRGAEAVELGWSNGSGRRTGLINDNMLDWFNRQSERDQTGDTRIADAEWLRSRQ